MWSLYNTYINTQLQIVSVKLWLHVSVLNMWFVWLGERILQYYSNNIGVCSWKFQTAELNLSICDTEMEILRKTPALFTFYGPDSIIHFSQKMFLVICLWEEQINFLVFIYDYVNVSFILPFCLCLFPIWHNATITWVASHQVVQRIQFCSG